MSLYIKNLPIASALLLTITATWSTQAAAQAAINIYGPGGPAPAMQEAAKAFGSANHLTVNVAAGPTNQWIDKARQDADVVFSGARREELLLKPEILQKTWILRKLLYNMDEIEAMEFMLDKMKSSKNNLDFFDMMRRGG